MSEEEVAVEEKKLGKTERKRRSGAFTRNLMNKLERVRWQNSQNPTNANFPTHTCNGKKNRSVVVMKKNGKRGRRV